jgi:hypothetical protein
MRAVADRDGLMVVFGCVSVDNCLGRANVSGRTDNDVIYWIFVNTKYFIQVNVLLKYFYIYRKFFCRVHALVFSAGMKYL